MSLQCALPAGGPGGGIGVEVEPGLENSTQYASAEKGNGTGPDLTEGSVFALTGAEAPSLEPSSGTLGATGSSLVLPDEDQDMSINDETLVKHPTPSGTEVEDKISRRLLEDRGAFIAANGVPRVVLILCSLFWKLEILKICDLLFGPEAPLNDDKFCRQMVENPV